MNPRPEGSHKDANEYRAASDPKPDRNAHPWDGDRKASKDQAEHQADEYEEKIRVTKLFLLEFIYTKWQSGTRHDRPATEEELKKNPDKEIYIVGGCDNYFNNGEYKSGWTYNGRTIGLPLFVPAAKDTDGITRGVVNNRIVAWNAGVAGKMFRKIPYTVKVTYSKNFGKYRQTDSFYDSVPRQVSGAFELTLPKRIAGNTTLVSLGLYADKGSIYPDTAGITIRLGWGDCFRN